MAVSFVSSSSNKSTAATVVITAPTGIQDGDILVAFVSVFRSTSATATSITGTGWTQWAEQITSTRYKCSMFWKRASSESGNYTFSSASATQMQGAIGVYRGCVASGDPRDVLSNTAYTTSGTIVRAASCTPTVANGMFVYGGWYYLAGTISLGTPTGMNARQTQANTNCAIRLADLAYTTTAASGTKDAAAGASCTVKHAMMVALKPLVQTSPTVTLNSPSDASVTGNITTVLNFTGTDAQSDTLEYEVQIDTVNTFDGTKTWMDSYSESNQNDFAPLGSPNDSTEKSAGGQTFTGNGEVIDVCQFYLKKVGSPTSFMRAKIYAHSGTWGSTGIPSTLLATSSPIASSELTTSYQLIEFSFPAAYTTTNGTKYVCVLDFTETGSNTNYIALGGDTVNKTHSGNACYYMPASTGWNYSTNIEICFYVGHGFTTIDALSVTDAGFTAGHPFASGTPINYTPQTNLAEGNTYYWRVRAKDPSGTNTFGAWSSTYSFVIPVAFISSWKTDNAGTSTSTQILLPLNSTYAYDFYAYWGDGSNSHITTYNQAEITHTYSVAGTYTVKVIGIFKGIFFAGGGDKLKIIHIAQWGCLKIGDTIGYHFYGCNNMACSATDILDLTGVIALESSFYHCWAFNGDLSRCDTSSVTNMYQTFRDCPVFNSDITGWDVSHVTDFSHMLEMCLIFDRDISVWNVTSAATLMRTMLDQTKVNCDLSSWDISMVTDLQYFLDYASSFSVDNYTKLLKAWALQNVQTGVPFGANYNQYYASAQASKDHLISVHGWTFVDGGSIADPVTDYLIKYYTGSVFADKPLKYYTGSTWATKPLKVYTGTQWILVT